MDLGFSLQPADPTSSRKLVTIDIIMSTVKDSIHFFKTEHKGGKLKLNLVGLFAVMEETSISNEKEG